MADTSEAVQRAVRHAPSAPRSIVELIRLGTLDAELAGLVWVLMEGRVPVIVAAETSGTGRSTLLAALLDFVAPSVRRVVLAGVGETFDWLPQAEDLGWLRPPGAGTGGKGPPIQPESTVLVVPEFSDDLPTHTWGEQARIAVRAASIGYGLTATILADGLEDVFHALGRPPVALTDDELSRLGVILVLRRVGPDGAPRVVAAHYVRPVARDEHGHVQRLGPAVLATWDPMRDGFEHFGWGITPELALRVGRRAGDFEMEVDRRRDHLAALENTGVTEVVAVRSAIDRFRATTDPTAASH